MEVGASVVRMRWSPVGLSATIVFPTPLKIQNDNFWYRPTLVVAYKGGRKTAVCVCIVYLTRCRHNA